jgi:hypothetical protein
MKIGLQSTLKSIALSLMSSLSAASLFIIPGIIVIKYQRLTTYHFIPCVLIAMTMMWTLIEMLWVATNAPDFSTAFYDALLPFLGLGFFLGLLTTGFAYGYSEAMRSRRRGAKG